MATGFVPMFTFKAAVIINRVIQDNNFNIIISFHLQMRPTTLAIHALLLVSFVYTQQPSRGFDLYHKFYELPLGQLKFFYCEIGGVKDVKVEYKNQDVSPV